MSSKIFAYRRWRAFKQHGAHPFIVKTPDECTPSNQLSISNFKHGDRARKTPQILVRSTQKSKENFNESLTIAEN